MNSWVSVKDEIPKFTRKDPSLPLNQQGDEDDMTASDPVQVYDTKHGQCVAYANYTHIMGDRGWINVPNPVWNPLIRGFDAYAPKLLYLDKVTHWKLLDDKPG